MCSATCGRGLQMQTTKKFVYTDLQQGMVAWAIITLQKVFLSVLKCLVVFTRRKTNVLVCQRYWMA